MPKKALQKKPTKYYLRLSLLLVGTLLITLSLSWKLYQAAKLSFIQYQPVPPIATVSASSTKPTRVIITKAKIDVPVAQSSIVNNIWQVNQKGASHLDSSANIGQIGNIIIYAHNTLNRFAMLNLAKPGTIITLTGSDGKSYDYTVIQKQVVYPNQIEVLKNIKGQQLILYTCTGLLDSQRLVVVAVPTN
jgi:LPXTG-site transpeptidase (sortase) family protein